MGVEADVANAIDETLRAVRAIDDARIDDLHGFEQFVEIGVIGKRNGVIDVEAVLRARIDRPAGHGETGLPPDAVEMAHIRRNDERLARLDVSLEQFEAAQWHAAMLVNFAHIENLAMLYDADAGGCQNLRHLLRLSQGVGQDDRRRFVLDRSSSGAR
jgi:hypothetical protein